MGLPPILAAHLLRATDALLIGLLQSLDPSEWEAPTIAGAWRVKDVAAHLLDTPLRKLSMVRDGVWMPAPEIRSGADLVAFINRLNEEGRSFYRRLSPRVLVSLLETAVDESARFHESLDPFAPAAFGVSWAGEAQSLNWFDTARELTERWHHQQQIRLAVGKSGIMTRELYHPVLDCFLRGLPHTYRDVAAPGGTLIQVTVAGECGGDWFLFRDEERWRLVAQSQGERRARIVIPQEMAWRIFTKGIERTQALQQVAIEGEHSLAAPVLGLTAIVG